MKYSCFSVWQTGSLHEESSECKNTADCCTTCSLTFNNNFIESTVWWQSYSTWATVTCHHVSSIILTRVLTRAGCWRSDCSTDTEPAAVSQAPVLKMYNELRHEPVTTEQHPGHCRLHVCSQLSDESCYCLVNYSTCFLLQKLKRRYSYFRSYNDWPKGITFPD